MIEIITLRILFQKGESFGLRLLIAVDNVVGLSEVNLIFVTNDLTLRLSLQRHFYNIAGLIVEKTVGIS